MSKLPFSREITRGLLLGLILLSAMLLAIAMYHSSRATAQQEPKAEQLIVPAVEEKPSAPAAEIATPPVEPTPNFVPPPPPPIRRPARPAVARTAPAPAISAAIHEEEAAVPPPPALSEAPVESAEEKTAIREASPETPQEAPQPSLEPPKPKPENRPMRWIKSLGRRLHIGGK